MKVPKALTIAGSDTSGGAGLQADIKTFQEFGVYGMTAITVLVAQNPANNWAHDVYPLSFDALEAQIKALAQFQDQETGLWHTIIIDKTSYLEASATAGFAYGILKAVRKRYIGKDYEAVAIRAIKGVLANIDDKGELQQVSFGTPVFDTIQGYKDIPLTSMPYGQSLAMLALGEFQRAFI